MKFGSSEDQGQLGKAKARAKEKETTDEGLQDESILSLRWLVSRAHVTPGVPAIVPLPWLSISQEQPWNVISIFKGGTDGMNTVFRARSKCWLRNSLLLSLPVLDLR